MFSMPTGAALWRRLRRDDDGVGLPEVMVALMILAVAVLGTASAVVSSLTSLRLSRDRQEASQAASGAIELTRALDYDAIALDTTELCGADPCWESDPLIDEVPANSGNFFFDPDGAGPMAAEPILAQAGGGVSPYRSTDGNLTIRRYVTAYDDPDVSPSTTDGRRVTTVVTWTSSGGNDRDLRMNSIVAEAFRGLPLPRFTVTPVGPAAGVPPAYDPTLGSPPLATERVCFEHVLVNVGARDSYEWGYDFDADGQIDSSVQAFLASPESPSQPQYGVYQNVGGDGWWAYASLSVDDTAPPVPMVDQDADDHPDSQVVVERNSNAKFSVCYINYQGNVANGNYGYPVVIRSAFDNDVKASVVHEFGASVLTTELFLIFDEADRTKGTFAMLPTIPVNIFAPGGRMREPCPSTCAVGGPNANLGLIDYDPQKVNEPGKGFQGLGFAPGNNGGAGRFDWQVSGDRTLGSASEDATLTFWSSWGSTAPSDAKGPHTVRYEFRLQRIDTAKGTKVVDDFVSVRAYKHNANASGNIEKWKKVSFQLTFPQTLFKDGQFLRLQVRCLNVISDTTGLPVSSADEVCHTAFGVKDGSGDLTPSYGTYESSLRFRSS